MSISSHAPVFIVLLPLTAALLCLCFSRVQRKLGAWIMQAALAGAFVAALSTLCDVLQHGGRMLHYWMGNWKPPIGIEFAVDPLNSAVLVMITFWRWSSAFMESRSSSTKTGSITAAITRCTAS